jgi:hypothetical protein
MKFHLSIISLLLTFSSLTSFSQFPLENQLEVSSLTPHRIEGELVFLQYLNTPDSAGFVVYDEQLNWMTTLDHSGISQYEFQYIGYISRYLFDDDDGIEFVVRDGQSGISDVHILNEDDTVIQSFQNRYINSGSCEDWDDIQNVGDHAVMHLSILNGSTQFVHSLPGRYNCCLCAEVANDPVMGCTYPDAMNYDPLAVQDDQSCQYNTCPGDFNNNLMIDTLDLLEFLSVFGSDCG